MLISTFFLDPGDIWERELASLFGPVWVCGDGIRSLMRYYGIKASDSALEGTSPAKLVSMKFLGARGYLGGGS